MNKRASIRFEDGAWPLWRVDKNIRYTLKSWLHDQRRTEADRVHYEAMHRYLERFASAPNERETLEIAAVGDLMWIPDGWKHPFDPTLRSAFDGTHVCFANLETPIARNRPVPRYAWTRFNAPESFLAAWHELAGASVLSLCNNHALDQGSEGLRQTRQTIEGMRGLRCVGGTNENEHRRLIEIAGVKIGVLGLSFGINPWHIDALDPANFAGIRIERFGCDKHEPDWSRLKTDLQALRADGADIIVLLPHWGFEYEYWPTNLQRQHAHKLLSLGADIIFGTSPHVLQPAEVVSLNGWDSECPSQLEREGPPSAGLICYSLGNFLSSMPTLACNTGSIVRASLRLGDRGGLELTSLNAYATATKRGRGRERQVRSASFAERQHCIAALGPIVSDAPA